MFGRRKKEMQKFLNEHNMEIVEDLEQGSPVPVGKTTLISLLERGEESVNGKVMFEWARQKCANAGGIRQAFRDKKEIAHIYNEDNYSAHILYEDRDYIRIYPATVLRERGDESDDRYFITLHMPACKWQLNIKRIERNWFDFQYRAVGRK
ncbi:MAG: hypothetical protein UV19_C0001G0035 [Parcubacteria group bacterium GW2011_GWA2_42_28]|nr:MAG: hypothetical protein UV19_C0001G0035 [Parcubacteria group bacterium GW2011_GWA2_42_28]KKT56230.1 MAG: hypothetical protein UW45_C0001G0034 [Parcubacteria group bacterium GW2011_GWC2_44_22]